MRFLKNNLGAPGFLQTLVCLLLLGWTAGLRQNLIAKQNVRPWRYCLISYLLAKMPALLLIVHEFVSQGRLLCTIPGACEDLAPKPAAPMLVATQHTKTDTRTTHVCAFKNKKSGPSGSAFFQSSQVPLACQKCTGPSAAMQPWTGCPKPL